MVIGVDISIPETTLSHMFSVNNLYLLRCLFSGLEASLDSYVLFRDSMQIC